MPLPRARDEVVVLEGNFAGVRGLLLHEHPSGKVTVELATGQRVKLEKGSVRLLLGSEVPRSTRRSTSPQYGGSPRSAGRSIVTPAADTFAPVLDRPASPVASSSTRAQEDAGVAELLEENRKLAERLAQAQTRAAAYYTPVRRQDSDLWDPPRTSRLPAAEELHRLPFSPPPPLVGSDREYRAAGTQVSRQGSQRSPLSTPGANIPMPAVANQPEFEPPAPYSTPTYEALHVVKEETDILTQQPSRPLDHVSFADPGSQHDRIPSRAQELYAPASPHHSTEAMPIQLQQNHSPPLANGQGPTPHYGEAPTHCRTPAHDRYSQASSRGSEGLLHGDPTPTLHSHAQPHPSQPFQQPPQQYQAPPQQTQASFQPAQHSQAPTPHGEHQPAQFSQHSQAPTQYGLAHPPQSHAPTQHSQAPQQHTQGSFQPTQSTQHSQHAPAQFSQHSQAPTQYGQAHPPQSQAPTHHTHAPAQYSQAPLQHSQSAQQHSQPPFQPTQHSQPPTQHSQPPTQHSQPPTQHSPPPTQHSQAPTQHNPTSQPVPLSQVPALQSHHDPCSTPYNRASAGQPASQSQTLAPCGDARQTSADPDEPLGGSAHEVSTPADRPEPNPHPELASGPHAYHHRHPVLVSAPNDNLLLRLQQLGTGIASLQDSMHQDAVAYSDMASRSVGLLYGE